MLLHVTLYKILIQRLTLENLANMTDEWLTFGDVVCKTLFKLLLIIGTEKRENIARTPGSIKTS